MYCIVCLKRPKKKPGLAHLRDSFMSSIPTVEGGIPTTSLIFNRPVPVKLKRKGRNSFGQTSQEQVCQIASLKMFWKFFCNIFTYYPVIMSYKMLRKRRLRSNVLISLWLPWVVGRLHVVISDHRDGVYRAWIL